MKWLRHATILIAVTSCHAGIEESEDADRADDVASRCRTESGRVEITASRHWVDVEQPGRPRIVAMSEFCGPGASVEGITRSYMSGRFAGPGKHEDNGVSIHLSTGRVSRDAPQIPDGRSLGDDLVEFYTTNDGAMIEEYLCWAPRSPAR